MIIENLNKNLAQILKGDVIIDVTNTKEAFIAEKQVMRCYGIRKSPIRY